MTKPEDIKVKAIIVMGVSGCGKSSVASLLSEALDYRFIEGDELHPQANIDKMTQGIPLQDEDRWPWLDRIGAELEKAKDESVIVTCSALKRVYRDRLRKAAGHSVAFVFLDGTEALLTERMGKRKGHFMPLGLLKTQLDTLEVPTGEDGVVTVDIDNTLEDIRDKALDGLAKLPG